MNKEENKYEVYMCKMDNEVIYIGSGKHGRHQHCTSGTSHVYELNKLHFSKCNVSVNVLQSNLSKEQSLRLEKELILQYLPRFNKVYKEKFRNFAVDKKTIMDVFVKSLIENGVKKSSEQHKKYIQAISDFITFYGITSLQDGLYLSIKDISKYKETRPFSIRLRCLDTSQYLYSIFNISKESKRSKYFIQLKCYS